MSDPMHDPILLMAGGMFIAVLCLLVAFGERGNGTIVRRAGRLRERLQAVATGIDLRLRRETNDKALLDRIVHRLTPQPEKLRSRLRRTGRDIGLGGYGLGCLVVAVIGGAVTMAMGLSFLVAVPVGLLVGLWLPHLAIKFLVNRRTKKFANLLPEAIGLMVRSIKSGLPITEAFQIIGRELPDPVGLEFRRLCDQIRIGQPLDQAMWDMANRVDVPEVKFLIVTLAVQRETGGNLAETLENLDQILRRRRQMRLKVKALSSEARASAAIIGALPFLMTGVLSVADPGYLAVLFNDHLGNLMLGGGCTSMSLGIIVMAKMVRFDI
jgi:tight adherence protein B